MISLRPRLLHLIALAAACALVVSAARAELQVRVTRVGDAPIITPEQLPGKDGQSINGPTLIRVPAWVKHPLGRYYLYFAHHAGKYIRMAYADRIEGPWTNLEGGVLPLTAQTVVANHVASPEAIVSETDHKIYLFYHGEDPLRWKRTAANPPPFNEGSSGTQLTSVAISEDGIHFSPTNTVLGPAYLRIFSHGGHWYALSDSGWLRTCPKLGAPFTKVALVIGDDMLNAVDPVRLREPGAGRAMDRVTTGLNRYAIRHVGLDVRGDQLVVYFTCVGHRPERVLATTIELTGPPESWKAKGVTEVLRPERPWEGADQPLAYSNGGISKAKMNQLRDPTVYREGDQAWLIYAAAGESALGLATLGYGEPIAGIRSEADVDRLIADSVGPRHPGLQVGALGAAWKSVVRDGGRPPVKVIIDTDIGTDIDDAIAVAFALRRPDLQVCGITTSRLYVEQRAAIVSRMLAALGRPDVPFAPGAAVLFDGSTHRDKPVDQYPFAGPPADRPKAMGDAQQLFASVIRRNWGQVWLVVLGPMTNAAVLIRDHPEIARGLAGISCMGGDLIRRAAETNIGNDPAAAAFVCRSGYLKFMGTDEVTMRLLITGTDVDRLRAMDSAAARTLLPLMALWRASATGKPGPVAFDVCPLAWLIAPDLFTTRFGGVAVSPHGITTDSAAAPPCAISTDMNVVGVHRLLMDSLR